MEKYIKTPVKKTKEVDMRKLDLERFDTMNIIWFLIKRHKFVLVSVWAVFVTIIHFFPFVPDVILAMF